MRPRNRVAGALLAALAGAALWAGGAQAGQPPPPGLAVSSAILWAPETNQVLDGVNPYARLPIASTTKMMTALVVMEHVHHLSSILTQNNYYAASVDSQIGLVPGERMSVHDLILGLMLPSADDAAEDLAYNVGHGSIGRFVRMMNARARQLGLGHTHYTTPIGLDHPGNYSSAADLVTLANFMLTHQPFLARVVAAPSAVLRTGSHVRYVVNRNTLVSRFRWVNGVKTGHTSGAGYVLVGSAHRNGFTLLTAVLGTSSEYERDLNTLALFAYGYHQFHLIAPVKAGELLARTTVKDRPGARAKLIAATGLRRIVANSSHVRIVIQAPTQLAGPLARQSRHGTAIVLIDGRPVARIALLLAQRLPAVSPITLAARFLTRGTTIFVLVMLLLVIGATFAVRRRKVPIGPVRA